MKAETKKILILAGIGVLAYMIFFRKKDTTTETIDVDAVEVDDEPIEDADSLDEGKDSSFSNGHGTFMQSKRAKSF